MQSHTNRRDLYRFAAGIAAIAAIVGSAVAQQGPLPMAPKVGEPLPPGSPFIGRPDNPAAVKLVPIPPPPLPTALDKLPIDKLKVPAGFKHIS